MTPWASHPLENIATKEKNEFKIPNSPNPEGPTRLAKYLFFNTATIISITSINDITEVLLMSAFTC